MFYSNSTNAFYAPDVCKNIPQDAVEITPEYHQELLVGKANGKDIRADNKGFPRLYDAAPLTPEQQKIQNEYDARQYLAQTDWYVVRSIETGKDIPEDVLKKRAAARESL